jgi:Stage II sporulation protein/Putative Ig domain
MLRLRKSQIGLLPRVFSRLLSLTVAAVWVAAVYAQREVEIRYLDSETGAQVQPASAVLESLESGATEESAAPDATGRARLKIGAGSHVLRIASLDHRTAVAAFTGNAAGPSVIRIWLDPVEPPPELRAEQIRSLHRPDGMVIVGLIVDEASAEPLAGVRVSCNPAPQELTNSTVATWTDARGMFRMLVPLTGGIPPEEGTATLVFACPGYRTLEYQHVQLWSGGDWTYRVRLLPDPNGAKTVIDERQPRRRVAGSRDVGSNSAGVQAASRELEVTPPAPEAVRQSVPASVSGATVRVPRTIRVLSADGTAIDYVSLDYYCRRVLPAEWIASWAAYEGGGQALHAGAVAVRTYAVGAVNKPKTSAYDICGTTACQVYGPATSTYTDAAVSATADCVMVGDGGTIPAALTEYSAENNSLGLSCGDGFTAPASGCLYDPVCAGESRNGHGRGLCQWGSAKWATGLKFPGNSTRDHTTVNGFPRRDWLWILGHYYPALQLVKGAPLMVGDAVTARTGLNVRTCPGGTISQGINCPPVTTELGGAQGVIVVGPTQVRADGAGYTWYQVRWADATGWSVENYLERVVSVPSPPEGLAESGAGTNWIDLSWTDSSDVEAGFRIERAPGTAGPWTQIAMTGANVTEYSDTDLYPSGRWCYRVKAFNSAGESEYSNVITAAALGVPPELPPLADQIVVEGATLTAPVQAAAPDFVQLLTDFESFPSQAANGVVLFREPRFSPTSRAFLADEPDLAVISDVFPPGLNASGRVLQVSCAFVETTRAWLRLTTAQAPVFPNPVIDLRGGLRFDLYADKPVGVAVGVRQTSLPPGTPIGSDGGTNGPVEWAGVTDVVSGQPKPVRSVSANTWTSCIFSFPDEPVRGLAGAEGLSDGVEPLAGTPGLGVLDHLALVPLGGSGVYNVYLDNFAVLTPKTLTYSLGPDAPAGAWIDGTDGMLTWTPGEQDAGQTRLITVRATDNGQPPLSASRTFRVTVVARPVLQASFSGSQFHLSWAGVQGVTYRVQFKNQLSDSVWTDLNGNLIATGAVASFADEPGASRRFYRVLIVN